MEIKISKSEEETKRGQAQLQTVESAFADLRIKYEESKLALAHANKVRFSCNSLTSERRNV
jgi:hypothetical protein